MRFLYKHRYESGVNTDEPYYNCYTNPFLCFAANVNDSAGRAFALNVGDVAQSPVAKKLYYQTLYNRCECHGL